jgi:hypothetical protein
LTPGRHLEPGDGEGFSAHLTSHQANLSVSPNHVLAQARRRHQSGP